MIYSSDLLRAHQTANIIAAKLMKEVTFDARLREIVGGLIEGTTEDERILKWGNDWRKQDLKMKSDENVLSRGMIFINEIFEKHPFENILIVSHGSFLKKILKNILPDEAIENSLLNTSITLLHNNKNDWNCPLFYCTKHLALPNERQK